MFEYPFSQPGYNRDGSAKADEAKRLAQSAERRIEDLQRQLGRLYHLTEAMWDLLKSKLDLSDADLEKLVEAIDLRESRLDGQPGPAPPACTNCNRTVSVKTGICLYCGEKMEKPGVF